MGTWQQQATGLVLLGLFAGFASRFAFEVVSRGKDIDWASTQHQMTSAGSGFQPTLQTYPLDGNSGGSGLAQQPLGNPQHRQATPSQCSSGWVGVHGQMPQEDNLRYLLRGERDGSTRIRGVLKDACQQIIVVDSATLSVAIRSLIRLLREISPSLSSAEQRFVHGALVMAVKQSPAACQGAVDDLLFFASSELCRASQTTAEEAVRKYRFKSKSMPFFYVHLSKAGGTSLCVLALQNGCQLVPRAKNCVPAANEALWHEALSNAHKEVSCEQYIQQTTLHNVTLLATEAFLDGGATPNTLPTLCSAFRYFTILRDPAERVLSHLDQPGLINSTLLRRDQLSKRERLEQMATATPEIFSNYMTRFLLGNRTYGMALDELSRDPAYYLSHAKAILEQMHVVLILEEESKSVLIEKSLGWKNSS